MERGLRSELFRFFYGVNRKLSSRNSLSVGIFPRWVAEKGRNFSELVQQTFPIRKTSFPRHRSIVACTISESIDITFLFRFFFGFVDHQRLFSFYEATEQLEALNHITVSSCKPTINIKCRKQIFCKKHQLANLFHFHVLNLLSLFFFSS